MLFKNRYVPRGRNDADPLAVQRAVCRLCDKMLQAPEGDATEWQTNVHFIFKFQVALS